MNSQLANNDHLGQTRFRVAVLGCGNVGAALVETLQADNAAIARRTGLQLEVAGIAVRDISKDRGPGVPKELLTDDPHSLVNSDEIDIVVEVMGGVEPAHQYLLSALKSGKSVVTANKELLAMEGPGLFEAAASSSRDLLFEAAVGGGIPLIRPLRESLAGEHITKVMGIVNGTTNFILSSMTEEGTSYKDALREAQRLGLAEPDPTADVEGLDAAAKAAILASVAFGVRTSAGDVYCEGIGSLTADDIAYANQIDHVVKLLAIVERVDDEVSARVYPAMVPRIHPLAAVRGSFNAVFIEGSTVGEIMLYGRGAGGTPTASAVLGDLLDAAHNLSSGGTGRSPILSDASTRPIHRMSSPFYLDLNVADEPGVLASVAGVFGKHGVSIRSMEQQGLGKEARLVFITHEALEKSMSKTVADLRSHPAVSHVGSLIRVIEPPAQ